MADNIVWDEPKETIAWDEPKSNELTWENVKQGAMNVPASLLINAAKPFYGLNQAAWQLAGKVAPSVANMGDYPVDLLNKRQAALNAEAGPASKFTTEPAALIGENLAPTALANKLTAAKNFIPSFGNMLATNMGTSMATAYANPEKTGLTPDEFAKEKAKSMGVAAALPVALGIGGSAVTNMISPQILPRAKQLLEQGVDLTPGQKMGDALKRLEDKLTSYPFVGGMIENSRKGGIESFDKAAFKRVLEPIGGKVPDVAGREGMEIVENQVKHTYNELLPKLNFKATPEFNTNMAQLREMSQNLPYDLGKTFNYDIDNIIAKRMSKNGTIDGTDFKKVEEDLSKAAKKYLSPNATASENSLGEAYKQALVNLRTTLSENNPQYAKELSDVNKAFANLSVVRKAASMANTQDMFTPSQLAAAVKASDTSAGKNRTAQGKALMQDLTDAGVSVLPSKIPDSGTASRMNVGPGGLTIGAASYLPYSALQAAMFKRPEFMNKLADALRGKSAYVTGPAVNKALGERNE
jgi:hypothetical protein